MVPECKYDDCDDDFSLPFEIANDGGYRRIIDDEAFQFQFQFHFRTCQLKWTQDISWRHRIQSHVNDFDLNNGSVVPTEIKVFE